MFYGFYADKEDLDFPPTLAVNSLYLNPDELLGLLYHAGKVYQHRIKNADELRGTNWTRIGTACTHWHTRLKCVSRQKAASLSKLAST